MKRSKFMLVLAAAILTVATVGCKNESGQAASEHPTEHPAAATPTADDSATVEPEVQEPSSEHPTEHPSAPATNEDEPDAETPDADEPKKPEHPTEHPH